MLAAAAISVIELLASALLAGSSSSRPTAAPAGCGVVNRAPHHFPGELCRPLDYADRRYRTRGNGDEAGRGAAGAHSGRAGGAEEEGLRRASVDRFHAGVRLLRPADWGCRRSLPRWPRWRAQRGGHARHRRRSSQPAGGRSGAAAVRPFQSSDTHVRDGPTGEGGRVTIGA
jgi:hypothetical protein